MECRPSGLTSLDIAPSVQTPSGGLIQSQILSAGLGGGPTVRISLPPPVGPHERIPLTEERLMEEDAAADRPFIAALDTEALPSLYYNLLYKS
jgi:hypothetical protein